MIKLFSKRIKMKTEQVIEKILYEVIEEKNNELDISMEKSLETCIIGPDSQLDSLGVLSFVVEVERAIEDEFQVEISLINEEFLNSNSNHMSTLKNLKLFLTKKIIEK
jgi:hypothetical protein